MKPYGTSNGGVKLHLEKKGKLMVFEQDNTIVCRSRAVTHSVPLQGHKNFQPSCLQEDKEDNWSEIRFQETPAPPNSLSVKGAVKC